MKKYSSINQVDGNASDKAKEIAPFIFQEKFENQRLLDFEREKTPNDLKIISLVNDVTNEIMEKYCHDNFDIPPENIHIITDDSEIDGQWSGVMNSDLQGIFVKEGQSKSKTAFAEQIFHEIVHMKSYNAMNFTSGEKLELKVYRSGFLSASRDGKKTFFNNLNEAIVEEITKRNISNVLVDPIFSEEMEETMETVALCNECGSESGEPFDSDEIYYAKIVTDEQTDEAYLDALAFCYQDEREILNSLIEKIFQTNSGGFSDKDEVFEMFEKAVFTGNIIPIAKIIEKSFGKGTFRRIGELDYDIQNQKNFVNSLR